MERAEEHSSARRINRRRGKLGIGAVACVPCATGLHDPYSGKGRLRLIVLNASWYHTAGHCNRRCRPTLFAGMADAYIKDSTNLD